MNAHIRRVIAASQVVGGVLGVLQGAGLVARAGPVSAAGLFFLLTLVAPFALHVVAGVLLWRGTPRGVPLSIAAQLLVALRVVSPFVSVYLFSALDLTVGLEWWWAAEPSFPPGAQGVGVWTGAKIGTGGHVAVLQGAPKLAIGLNAAAIAALVLLIRARRAGSQTAGPVLQPAAPPGVTLQPPLV